MGRYVITGVSGGIGAAVATRLDALGHDVCGIRRPGGAAPDCRLQLLIDADLSQPDTLAGSLSDFLSGVQRLEGIVHCAGIVRPGVITASTPMDFIDQFTVNVVAVAELTRLCLVPLQAGGATVVLVNSGSGLNARTPMGAYAVSKFGLKAYADVLRAEQPGLRVCSVYPGRTATTMQRQVRAAEGGTYRPEEYVSAETVASVICSALLLAPDAVITDLTVRPRGQVSAPSPDDLAIVTT
jgi:NAD(P)-dependent dehydrogenase (short-subunit alcohol dehydrogenase family)